MKQLFKKMTRITIAIFAVVFVIVAVSCKKSNDSVTDPKAGLPILETAGVGEITRYTATCGGGIASDGGSTITARGVCWSTGTTPTVADPHTTDGAGAGFFISNISGLNAGTVYFVKAYATNGNGTAYGSAMSFTTLPGPPSPPTVITGNISNITQVTATCGGNVTLQGSAAVTDKGICWSETADPSFYNSVISAGPGLGPFSIQITGLKGGTTYHVRAYADNGLEIGFGEDKSFTTTAYGTLYIESHAYHTINIGTQTWTIENLMVKHYRNGDPIDDYSGPWQGYVMGFYIKDPNHTYMNEYGYLYNYYAIADPRKLAPDGWHVSTDQDWSTLLAYIGGANQASPKMRVTGWEFWYNNDDATNSSGFSAIGEGFFGNDGNFYSFMETAQFWTSTEINRMNAYHYEVSTNQEILRNAQVKEYGFSVRLVKD